MDLYDAYHIHIPTGRFLAPSKDHHLHQVVATTKGSRLLRDRVCVREREREKAFFLATWNQLSHVSRLEPHRRRGDLFPGGASGS
jgi:hypothetical protein